MKARHSNAFMSHARGKTKKASAKLYGASSYAERAQAAQERKSLLMGQMLDNMDLSGKPTKGA